MKRIFIILAGLFLSVFTFAGIDGNRDIITYDTLNSTKPSISQVNILSNKEGINYKKYTVSKTTTVIADFYDLQTAINAVSDNSVLLLYPGVYDLGVASLWINKPISIIAIGDGQANYGNTTVIKSAGAVTIKIDFDSNDLIYLTGLYIVSGSSCAVYNDNNQVSMYLSNCYLSAPKTGLYWNNTAGGLNIYKSNIEATGIGLNAKGSAISIYITDSQISGFANSAIHLLDATASSGISIHNSIMISSSIDYLINCSDASTEMKLKITNSANVNLSPQKSNIIYDKSGEL